MSLLRREFVAALLAAIVFPAFGQERDSARRVRVAWLGPDEGVPGEYLGYLRAALAERELVVGQNVEIRAFKTKIAGASIAEVLAWRPDAIVAIDAKQAKSYLAATSTIPIVFLMVPDPVAAGLVQSLTRPGANATGLALSTREYALKRLEVVRVLLPSARRIALLFDSTSDDPTPTLVAMRAAAGTLALEETDTAGNVDAALQKLRKSRPAAVLITGILTEGDYFEKAVAFQQASRIPVFDDDPLSAQRGMVIGLGEAGDDTMRRAGDVLAKVLKGTKPSEIPVDVAARIQLWINLRAARSLHLEIPEVLLARADRVFQ